MLTDPRASVWSHDAAEAYAEGWRATSELADDEGDAITRGDAMRGRNEGLGFLPLLVSRRGFVRFCPPISVGERERG